MARPGRVRPMGFNDAELGSRDGQSAKEQLACLVLNQRGNLRETYRVDRGRLICDVFF